MNFAIAQVDPGPLLSWGVVLLFGLLYTAAAAFSARRGSAGAMGKLWGSALVLGTGLLLLREWSVGTLGHAPLAIPLMGLFLVGMPTAATSLVLLRVQRRRSRWTVAGQVIVGMGAFLVSGFAGLCLIIVTSILATRA